MKDKIKYNLWTSFLEEYKQYIKNFEDIWYQHFEDLKTFIAENRKCPRQCIKKSVEHNNELVLGKWLSHQQKNYKNKNESMREKNKYDLWTEFLEKYKGYFISDDDNWYTKFEELKIFIDKNNKTPIAKSKNEIEKTLANWLSSNQQKYKIKSQSMKDEAKYKLWTKFLEEYKDLLNSRSQKPVENTQETVSTVEEEEITKINQLKKSMKLPKPSTTKETSTQKKACAKSEISELHKEYKTLKSENLNNKFKQNPDLWTQYHQISEENEKSFPEEEIPRNRVIRQLDKIKTKRTKRIVDLGCGKGQIFQYYKDDKRFMFHNYDHISSNKTIISCDISNIPLEEDSVEICILSLAMWGSNCREYIQEANRILETGGKLYIIEPTKRWSEKDELGNIIKGKEGSKLKSLLEENNFQIIEQSIDKFCMFVCIIA
jgi:ribosomal RNA-processing protein 8